MTTSGTTEPAAPSPNTCAVVSTNATTSSAGRLSEPVEPSSANVSAATICTAYAEASTVVRRTRSITTPANSESSSHGACPATFTRDTARGSVVIETASKGSAASKSPSQVEPDTATACRRTQADPLPPHPAMPASLPRAATGFPQRTGTRSRSPDLLAEQNRSGYHAGAGHAFPCPSTGIRAPGRIAGRRFTCWDGLQRTVANG